MGKKYYDCYDLGNYLVSMGIYPAAKWISKTFQRLTRIINLSTYGLGRYMFINDSNLLPFFANNTKFKAVEDYKLRQGLTINYPIIPFIDLLNRPRINIQLSATTPPIAIKLKSFSK